MSTMTTEEAKRICKELAEHKKRWGKLAGNAGISEAKIRAALVMLYDAGQFDIENDKVDVVAANRAKGAAEARAKKYKNQLDEANEKIVMLEAELAAAKKDGTKSKLWG